MKLDDKEYELTKNLTLKIINLLKQEYKDNKNINSTVIFNSIMTVISNIISKEYSKNKTEENFRKIHKDLSIMLSRYINEVD